MFGHLDRVAAMDGPAAWHRADALAFAALAILAGAATGTPADASAPDCATLTREAAVAFHNLSKDKEELSKALSYSATFSNRRKVETLSDDQDADAMLVSFNISEEPKFSLGASCAVAEGEVVVDKADTARFGSPDGSSVAGRTLKAAALIIRHDLQVVAETEPPGLWHLAGLNSLVEDKINNNRIIANVGSEEQTFVLVTKKKNYKDYRAEDIIAGAVIAEDAPIHRLSPATHSAARFWMKRPDGTLQLVLCHRDCKSTIPQELCNGDCGTGSLSDGAAAQASKDSAATQSQTKVAMGNGDTNTVQQPASPAAEPVKPPQKKPAPPQAASPPTEDQASPEPQPSEPDVTAPQAPPVSPESDSALRVRLVDHSNAAIPWPANARLGFRQNCLDSAQAPEIPSDPLVIPDFRETAAGCIVAFDGSGKALPQVQHDGQVAVFRLDRSIDLTSVSIVLKNGKNLPQSCSLSLEHRPVAGPVKQLDIREAGAAPGTDVSYRVPGQVPIKVVDGELALRLSPAELCKVTSGEGVAIDATLDRVEGSYIVDRPLVAAFLSFGSNNGQGSYSRTGRGILYRVLSESLRALVAGTTNAARQVAIYAGPGSGGRIPEPIAGGTLRTPPDWPEPEDVLARTAAATDDYNRIQVEQIKTTLTSPNGGKRAYPATILVYLNARAQHGINSCDGLVATLSATGMIASPSDTDARTLVIVPVDASDTHKPGYALLKDASDLTVVFPNEAEGAWPLGLKLCRVTGNPNSIVAVHNLDNGDWGNAATATLRNFFRVMFRQLSGTS